MLTLVDLVFSVTDGCSECTTKKFAYTKVRFNNNIYHFYPDCSKSADLLKTAALVTIATKFVLFSVIIGLMQIYYVSIMVRKLNAIVDFHRGCRFYLNVHVVLVICHVIWHFRHRLLFVSNRLKSELMHLQPVTKIP